MPKLAASTPILVLRFVCTKILDVGCGRRPLRGENVITVDQNARFRPTVVHDLSVFPWPFDDNTFDFIHCAQVIEHLPDTVSVMQEILRIAMPGCRVYIGVPHFSSAIAVSDPTHKTFFSVKTMDYFCGDFGNYLALKPNKCFEIISRRIVFSRLWKVLGLAALFNLSSRLYEEKLHGLFPAKYISWELLVSESCESPARAAA